MSVLELTHISSKVSPGINSKVSPGISYKVSPGISDDKRKPVLIELKQGYRILLQLKLFQTFKSFVYL